MFKASDGILARQSSHINGSVTRCSLLIIDSHGDSGEQSVGKSYALNHFVDTSFAGSAMRCTEGVWLSVTPTQDALVVSMDFEGNNNRVIRKMIRVLTLPTGVNSIERSAQEGEHSKMRQI